MNLGNCNRIYKSLSRATLSLCVIALLVSCNNPNTLEVVDNFDAVKKNSAIPTPASTASPTSSNASNNIDLPVDEPIQTPEIEPTPIPNNYPEEVNLNSAVKFELDRNEAYLVTPTGYGLGSTYNVIYHTLNNGEAWDLVYEAENDESESPLKFQVKDMYFFDSDNGIAVGAAGKPFYLYQTNNGGKSWRDCLSNQSIKENTLPVIEFNSDIDLENALDWGKASISIISDVKIQISVHYVVGGKEFTKTSIFDKNDFFNND